MRELEKVLNEVKSNKQEEDEEMSDFLRTPFEDLPIIFDDVERYADGWERKIKRETSVRELLEIWDIETCDSAMVQVLRHLRKAMGVLNDLNKDISEFDNAMPGV